MKAVRADYPTEWTHANVYTLADLHIGDPHSIPAEVTRRVRQAENDPQGLVILNGDLMNTHLPMIMKQSFFRVDASNCCAKPVEKLFVNTGAALDYGGYGQAQEFKPAAVSTPVIRLDAKDKRMSATL